MALSHTFAVEANNSGNATTLTTGSFDSTGYEYLVVFCKHEGSPVTITVSDNKSSSPVGLTKVNHGGGALSAQLHHGAIGSPGTGHTVTMTLSTARTWRDVAVWLIANGGAGVQLDVEAAGASGTGTAPDAGSVVATAAAIHIFGSGHAGSPATLTPSAGWTKDSQVAENLKASRNEASATTTDPSATTTGSSDWAAVAAAFKTAAVAATRGKPFGHEGTAFNGGRTFAGIIGRENAWQPQMNSSHWATIRNSGSAFVRSFCSKQASCMPRAARLPIIRRVRYSPARSCRARALPMHWRQHLRSARISWAQWSRTTSMASVLSPTRRMRRFARRSRPIGISLLVCDA